jgi:hypothetical protein
MGLKLVAGMVVVVLLACVAGCGGGGNSSSSTSTATTEKKEGAEGAQSKDVSAQFLKKDGSNKFFVEYGKEAPVAEREAAGEVLAKSLEAREDKDFVTQCATLTKKQLKELAIGKPHADPKTLCPKELERFAKPYAASKTTREDNFKPPLAALRVKGKAAYGLFHGTNGTNYAFLMEKEGGQWKVAALLANEI